MDYKLYSLIAVVFCSSALVSYALLRVETENSELGMFLVSVLVFVFSILTLFDDAAALVRDSPTGGELFASVTATLFLLLTVWFVGYTSYDLLS